MYIYNVRELLGLPLPYSYESPSVIRGNDVQNNLVYWWLCYWSVINSY